MRYIDFNQLEKIDAESYRVRKPFPWINPTGLLTEQGYLTLLGAMPDVSQFNSSFGLERKNDQTPHDRFILEYDEHLAIADVWHEFIAELRSARYKNNLCRLLDEPSVALNFHWHYTPDGCFVSPHADSPRKAGSHIFYFNTDEDWKSSWGGHTILLDDGGQMPSRSSPTFDDFSGEVATQTLGNRSLLFTRTDHAWHGVRPISCPENRFRKVFIVVINRNRFGDRVRRRFVRREFHYY
ncbi:MAG: 2OG-Fe(II) oxygenase [Gammaproteobacteria bacterium]